MVKKFRKKDLALVLMAISIPSMPMARRFARDGVAGVDGLIAVICRSRKTRCGLGGGAGRT